VIIKIGLHKYLGGKNMSNIRTDLAIEARELYRQKNNSDIPGVDVDIRKDDDMAVTKVKIVDRAGAKIMNKPIGNYITIEVPRLRENDIDLREDVSRILAQELIDITDLKEDSVILVVGLGNWNITPDALGPKVIEKLLVTRHIKENIPEQIDESTRSVCAISPGVLGLTGIETSEIIRGVVDRVKPNLVVVIDALASRKMDRVSTTIQLADTGINPGSGVGNNRKEISEESLGVPVIAIGVPTVVDAATMANDTIDLVIDSLINSSDKGSDFYKMLKDMNRDDKYKLITEVISPKMPDLMVTPKEIDELINDISKVIANGLNIALHPGIGMDGVNRFLN